MSKIKRQSGSIPSDWKHVCMCVCAVCAQHLESMSRFSSWQSYALEAFGKAWIKKSWHKHENWNQQNTVADCTLTHFGRKTKANKRSKEKKTHTKLHHRCPVPVCTVHASTLWIYISLDTVRKYWVLRDIEEPNGRERKRIGRSSNSSSSTASTSSIWGCSLRWFFTFEYVCDCGIGGLIPAARPS